MEVAIQIVLISVWLPLNLLVTIGMLRGDYRRFPMIFGYVVVQLLATAAEIPAYWAVYSHTPQAVDLQIFVYWLDEAIAQVLVYVIVLDLIYRATSNHRARRPLRTGIVLGAILFAGISFLIHYKRVQAGIWMTPWTRDLNFCAAVLDLALWALLIASGKKDSRVLLLSGGLGIQFAGQALGESVRQLSIMNRSHTIALIGSTLVVVSEILRSYIWWQVFRKPPAATDSSPPARLRERNP